MNGLKNSSQQQRHVSLGILIRLAVSNIRYKLFRSALTIAGVVLGVGSVYMLLSFGLGIQNLVQDQVLNNQAINTIDVTSSSAELIKITPDTVKQVSSIQHVTKVSGLYVSSASVKLQSAISDTVVYGADRNYINTSSLGLTAGSLYDDTSSGQAVVNTSFLEAIGVKNAKDVLGKKISIVFDDIPFESRREKEVIISGVFKSNVGSEIYVSPVFFKEQNRYIYTQMRASVDQGGNITVARQAIESLGMETTSPIDTVNQINDIFRFFNLALIGIGSIGMVIAVLGMLNTLTVSLLERTREIGLMMTIGARSRDIRHLFIVEAMILSLVGGVAGLLLASITGTIVDGFLNASAQQRGVIESFSLFYISPLLIIGTLLFTLLIGLLVALVPSYRAARVDPIEALRHD